MHAVIQMQLAFKAPRVDRRAEELILVGFLRDKTDWVLCSTIEAALGWSDRKVRQVASDSDWVIGRIGYPGYKFIHNATADEYQHYRNARRKSVRELLGKVRRTDRVYFNRQQPGEGAQA